MEKSVEKLVVSFYNVDRLRQCSRLGFRGHASLLGDGTTPRPRLWLQHVLPD